MLNNVWVIIYSRIICIWNYTSNYLLKIFLVLFMIPKTNWNNIKFMKWSELCLLIQLMDTVPLIDLKWHDKIFNR